VRARAPGLRTRVLLLVAAAVLPAFGLLLYEGLRTRAHLASEVQQDAFRLAQLVAHQEAREFEEVRATLAALASVPVVRDADPQKCGALLREFVRQFPRYINLGVARRDGVIFCSALPLPGRVSVADRPYFQRSLRTGSFAVGEFQIGRLSHRASVNAGYPLLDEGGRVRGVLFAAVDLGWLSAQVGQIHLPRGAEVLVVDRRGVVLVRTPGSASWAGRVVSSAAIVRRMRSSPGGGTADVQGLDGERRLYGFTQIEGGSASVAVGIPHEAALGPVDRTLAGTLAGLALLGGLTLVIAWVTGGELVLRPIHQLLRTARRLGEGDMGVRTGLQDVPGELGDLARAFDAMADSLAERGAQIRLLIESTGEGICGIDLSGRVTFINRAGADMLGAPPDALVGESLHDLLHAPPQGAAPHAPDQCPLVAVARTGRGVTQEDDRVWRRDGTSFPAQCSSFPLRDDGTVRGAVVTFRDVTARYQAQAEIEGHLRQLQALRDIDMAITGSVDLRVTLAILLEKVTAELDVDAALVLLLDPGTGLLACASARGCRTASFVQCAVRVGEGHAGRAALERRLVVVPRLADSPDVSARMALYGQEGFVGCCAVPLVAKGQVQGVLEVFSRRELAAGPKWLQFLEALAGQAAIAVDNARLLEELRRSHEEVLQAYDATLEGWCRALDLRDRETEGHTLRVTEQAVALARAVGIPERDLVHMRRGALLHDIGKMAIPDSILLKPGPLTPEEWAVMRLHPVYAHELLSPIPYLRPALEIPYGHHERWDGTGYPRGLKGEEIPLPARIFAVVDVWDALRSDRPYRAAWSREDARAYIAREAGRQFDPAVVEVFLRTPLPEPIAPAEVSPGSRDLRRVVLGARTGGIQRLP
jgi:PAS domain S-box-containing protein